MNIFQTIASSLHTIGDLQADVAAEVAGQTPDYKPLANDILGFAQGKVKVSPNVTPERLSTLFVALHGVIQAVIAFFEPATV